MNKIGYVIGRVIGAIVVAFHHLDAGYRDGLWDAQNKPVKPIRLDKVRKARVAR